MMVEVKSKRKDPARDTMALRLHVYMSSVELAIIGPRKTTDRYVERE